MSKLKNWLNEPEEKIGEEKMKSLIRQREKLIEDAQSIEGRGVLIDFIEEAINSKGLRRSISADFMGSTTNEEIAKGLLYTIMLVSDGFITQKVFAEVETILQNDME